MTVINCAYIGGLTGIVKRRGRGLPVVVLVSVVAGAVFGVAAVLALLIASRLRELVFTAMTANVDGSVAILELHPRAAARRREVPRAVRRGPGPLADPDLLLRAVRHHGRQPGRLVGAVAGADPAVRGARCAQAGNRHHRRRRSPRSR